MKRHSFWHWPGWAHIGYFSLLGGAVTAEAERQAKGEAIDTVKETTMDDLGLEVGAALADAGGSLGDR